MAPRGARPPQSTQDGPHGREQLIPKVIIIKQEKVLFPNADTPGHHI